VQALRSHRKAGRGGGPVEGFELLEGHANEDGGTSRQVSKKRTNHKKY
jgi:hypothetical protein